MCGGVIVLYGKKSGREGLVWVLDVFVMMGGGEDTNRKLYS